MTQSRTDILNLINGLAETFDAGDLEGAVNFLANGHFFLGDDRKVSPQDMLIMWRQILILYDGSPRTRHIVTNPILDIDETASTARCRSTYTVHQQIPGGPLKTIVIGTYDDRFERVDGIWRFSERRYSGMDLVGDLSNHLTVEAIEQFAKE